VTYSYACLYSYACIYIYNKIKLYFSECHSAISITNAIVICVSYIAINSFTWYAHVNVETFSKIKNDDSIAYVQFHEISHDSVPYVQFHEISHGSVPYVQFHDISHDNLQYVQFQNCTYGTLSWFWNCMNWFHEQLLLSEIFTSIWIKSNLGTTDKEYFGISKHFLLLITKIWHMIMVNAYKIINNSYKILERIPNVTNWRWISDNPYNPVICNSTGKEGEIVPMTDGTYMWQCFSQVMATEPQAL
jgi:hypothetical protein